MAANLGLGSLCWKKYPMPLVTRFLHLKCTFGYIFTILAHKYRRLFGFWYRTLNQTSGFCCTLLHCPPTPLNTLQPWRCLEVTHKLMICSRILAASSNEMQNHHQTLLESYPYVTLNLTYNPLWFYQLPTFILYNIYIPTVNYLGVHTYIG